MAHGALGVIHELTGTFIRTVYFPCLLCSINTADDHLLLGALLSFHVPATAASWSPYAWAIPSLILFLPPSHAGILQGSCFRVGSSFFALPFLAVCWDGAHPHTCSSMLAHQLWSCGPGSRCAWSAVKWCFYLELTLSLHSRSQLPPTSLLPSLCQSCLYYSHIHSFKTVSSLTLLSPLLHACSQSTSRLTPLGSVSIVSFICQFISLKNF